MTLPSTIILGGGPGGTGPLVWAAQTGFLDAWLDQGIVLVDSQPQLGGTLGRYAINSDTLGGAYLECLEAGSAHLFLREMRTDPVAQEMQGYRKGFPPLSLVGRFMARLSAGLHDVLARHPRCVVLNSTTARSVTMQPDGSVRVTATGRTARRYRLQGRSVVMALGGAHPTPFPAYHGASPVLPSDTILTPAGLRQAADILRQAKHPRVVILGGSHSAYSVAWALTHLLGEQAVRDLDVVLLSRREPPVFYGSAAAAAADGYAFVDGDICPRTGRVNRLGGLRGNGRDIWRQMRHHPGSLRVRCQNEMELSAPELRALLTEAVLLVPAFGYRSRQLPVLDHAGAVIALQTDPALPVVDAECKLYCADGSVLPNVFGIGLGTGFRPTEAMGGEPNFTGQANSLWLYQNDIGATVFRGVQQAMLDQRPAPSRLARAPVLREALAFG